MDKIIDLLDDYITSTFPKTGVPGSAVVIIQNGKNNIHELFRS